MHKLRITFLILIIPFFSQSQNYGKGDTLNVLCPFGAEVRSTPSSKGELIFELEYGEKVEVMEIGYESEELIEYKSGNWILIAAQFGTGYAFDGNLSKLKIPNPKYIETNDLLSYFRNQYSKTNCGVVYDRPETGVRRVIDSIQVHDSNKTIVSRKTYMNKYRVEIDGKIEEKDKSWFAYEFIIKNNRYAEMITLIELFYHQKDGEKVDIKEIIYDAYLEDKRQIMFTYGIFNFNTIVIKEGEFHNKIEVEKF